MASFRLVLLGLGAVLLAACRPPYVELTVTDPDGLATGATEIAIGADRSALEARAVNSAFPLTIIVLRNSGQTGSIDLWVEASDGEDLVALGFGVLAFPGRGNADATISLSAVCERSATLGLPCVDPTDGDEGICDGAACADPATVEFCLVEDDCTTPPACQALPASCVGGTCRYQAVPAGTLCDDNSACTDRDRCDAAGSCVGDPVICDEVAGLCRQSVGCDVEAGCLYVDSDEGLVCVREDTELVGSCSAGVCEECLFDDDCPDDGDPRCVTKACVDNTCAYTPLTGVECEAGRCVGGALVNPRVCQEGFCSDDGGEDCIGFVCKDSSCPVTCAENPDCVGDLTCELPAGTCIGLKNDGVACTLNGECFNTCVGGICAPQPGIDGACDDTADCAAGQDCFACPPLGDCAALGGPTSVCRLDFGVSCTDNADCAGTCIEGNCQPHADLRGSCDDTADCLEGACFFGECLLDLGESCSSNNTCDSRECVNGICCSEDCGVCHACAADGLGCEEVDDDDGCGVLDCAALDAACLTHDPIGDRCSAGVCKTLLDCVDRNEPTTTVCAAGGEVCDGEEYTCDGTSPTCPNGTFSFWEQNTVCADPNVLRTYVGAVVGEFHLDECLNTLCAGQSSGLSDGIGACAVTRTGTEISCTSCVDNFQAATIEDESWVYFCVASPGVE